MGLCSGGASPTPPSTLKSAGACGLVALPGFFHTAVRVTVSNPDGVMSFSTEDFMAPPVALRIKSRIPKKAKSSPDCPLCRAWRPWLSLLQAAGFTPPLACAPGALVPAVPAAAFCSLQTSASPRFADKGPSSQPPLTLCAFPSEHFFSLKPKTLLWET